MPTQPIYATPGVQKTNSDYSSGKQWGYGSGRNALGRYSDCNNVEFIAGFPQKIAGFTSAFSISSIMGTIRNLKAWRDVNGVNRLAIGTDSHLYSWNGSVLTDVTPRAPNGSITVASQSYTSTSSSTTLTISLTAFSSGTQLALASAITVGDWVGVFFAAPIVGVTVSGYFKVTQVTANTSFKITMPAAANAGTTANAFCNLYFFKQQTINSNPFATTNGSNIVTVTPGNNPYYANIDANGTITTIGNYVTFTGATTFNNVTISGEYLMTPVNSTTFTIVAGTTANASSSGGGSAVLFTYTCSMIQTAYGLTKFLPNGWSLAAYGGLLCASPIGNSIYFYDPVAGGSAYPIAFAPQNCISMFVTPERMIVALGGGCISTTQFSQSTLYGNYLSPNTAQFAGGALCVMWCDQTDPTAWTSLTTNTAQTGRTLIGGDYFVGGIAVRDGISLIFTNRCTFAMNYSGDYLIYDTPLLANNSGLIGPNAVCSTGGNAYWMSDKDLWSWNGSVVPVQTDDIRDFLFTSINQSVDYKCLAGVDRQKKQVRFWYPSGVNTDNSNFVILQLDSLCFSIGNIGRNGWADSELYNTPYGADANGVYTEETGTDANGSALDASLTFSPFDVSNGDLSADIFGFVPDFDRLTGNISLTINTRYYPQDPPTLSGPYTITATDTTPRIDLRCDGKLFGWTLDSNVLGGDFRLGLVRIQVQPSGARN